MRRGRAPSLQSQKLAVVVEKEDVEGGRFAEMALEANRGNSLFHIFTDEEKAGEWLVTE